MSGFAFERLDLPGAYLIEGFHAGDGRGGLTKCFEESIFAAEGISFHLSETFLSVSARNVLRGMHFQLRGPQAKLVSVPCGSAWDVIVDLRSDSATYLQWRSYELSAENHQALYIPRGFAHGFLSWEDGTVMLYQCDGRYDRETDTGIRYDDPEIGIVWPKTGERIISERDMGLPYLAEREIVFVA